MTVPMMIARFFMLDLGASSLLIIRSSPRKESGNDAERWLRRPERAGLILWPPAISTVFHFQP